MKKAFDWLIQFMGVVFITMTVGPCVIGLVLGSIFVFCVGVLGMDPGPDKDARAVAALKKTCLTEYVEYAPYHAMCIDSSLTAFIMPKYDNHEDNSNLWEGVMTTAATSPNWHVEAVTCDAYAAKLNAIFPEAAFLRPADVTFDAWYENAERLAFFDQDTGLMVQLQVDTQPHSGRIRLDGLTIPHDGFMYEYETHGGFHGDGTTFQALIVPEDKRTAFESTLTQHGDWHAGTVTRAEYITMHDKLFYEVPPLYPNAGTDFEWWCYVDTFERMYPEKSDDDLPDNRFPAVMHAAGAHHAGNWLVGLYDADTGLFIFYEYDS